MIRKLNFVNYENWFRALGESTQEIVFNYVKFGLWCGKHEKKLTWNATKVGGGGYDTLVCERPVNKDACFDFVREELKCPVKGCHTRVIITFKRDEIRDEEI